MRDDLLDREQAEQLAREICDLDGVAGLYGGQFGEVAMLFPGERVRGLHASTPRDDSEAPHLEVFVIVDGDLQPNLEELASTIRDTAARYTDAPVDVTVSDVE
ncbi:hypothetical protein ACFSSC_01430 [Corynebacterium mendelii]|uniref:Asp23/Gls24 family envelope stress response protein n=1 Tax=Corynebacterium mendelii TaxID=2765362 RepID=A0A939IV75_9CORY|nr:hypothetical protein [Corynebacterium mendelii]MBN9643941.1 hypothetical protein [Corynebacterium mendelii]